MRAGVEPARESQLWERNQLGQLVGVRAGVEPARESQLWRVRPGRHRREACAPASSRRGSLNNPHQGLAATGDPVRAGVEPARESQLDPPRGSRGRMPVRAGVEPARESQQERQERGGRGRQECAPASSRRGSLNMPIPVLLAPVVRCAPASSRRGSLNVGDKERRAGRHGVRAGVEPARESQHLLLGGNGGHLGGARRRRAGAGVSTESARVGGLFAQVCAPASSRRGSLNGWSGVGVPTWQRCAPASSRRGSLNCNVVSAPMAGIEVRAGVEPARESQPQLHSELAPNGIGVRAGVEPARESQP